MQGSSWTVAWIAIKPNQIGYKQQHTDRILEVFGSSLSGKRQLYEIDYLASSSEQIVGGAHSFTDRGMREELTRCTTIHSADCLWAQVLFLCTQQRFLSFLGLYLMGWPPQAWLFWSTCVFLRVTISGMEWFLMTRWVERVSVVTMNGGKVWVLSISHTNSATPVNKLTWDLTTNLLGLHQGEAQAPGTEHSLSINEQGGMHLSFSSVLPPPLLCTCLKEWVLLFFSPTDRAQKTCQRDQWWSSL